MTAREQRVQKALEAAFDALGPHNLNVDDLASVVFSMALRLVLVLKGMGADMSILQGSTMRLMAECMPPVDPKQAN